MKQTQVFSGSSHPVLVNLICERLGTRPAQSYLGKFANGETSVQLNTSIREQDVFIVQSSGDKVNDDLMELLIMCSACRSGSAKSVTAVMPYFPYSRQSKKKSHRGSITARMVANLLHVAGVDHVITLDLHASQMQGFFRCPVDNLQAEGNIIHWLKFHVPDYRKAVVVSKNPGGTKRVTSMADALKLNFGIVMTDRARPTSGRTSAAASAIFDPQAVMNQLDGAGEPEAREHTTVATAAAERESFYGKHLTPTQSGSATPARIRAGTGGSQQLSLRLSYPTNYSLPDNALTRVPSVPSALRESEQADTDDDEDESPRTRNVVTGRLIHGHIVDDDAPSPSISASPTVQYRKDSGSTDSDGVPSSMLTSVISVASTSRRAFANGNGLGGSGDAQASDDEEDQLRDPELESTVTLVGNVRDKPVFIVDDMIDKPASWIAAAETVVKRGGATSVYCMATHGLFAAGCLEEMEACDCITKIIVTNTIPMSDEKIRGITKLHIIDVCGLLSEAIRRKNNGESNERLYGHYE